MRACNREPSDFGFRGSLGNHRMDVDAVLAFVFFGIFHVTKDVSGELAISKADVYMASKLVCTT